MDQPWYSYWRVWPQREVAVDLESSSSGCQAAVPPSARYLRVHFGGRHDARKEEEVVITEVKSEELDLV